MNLLQAIVYGIVQGLTEFLPISSNAHLRLVPELFGWTDPGAAFTAVIQLGTTAAVLIYFRREIAAAFRGFVGSLRTGDRSSHDAKVGWGVLYGTIPIVVLGLVLKKPIETTFRSLWFIAVSFIVMGGVMLFAEAAGKRTRGLESATVDDGVKIGLWQCLALIPGMSRSGSTISGGLFADFDHVAAARFSFLLGIPSIAGAGLYEAFKERKAVLAGGQLGPTLVATAVSFVVGYLSIAWLLGFLQKRGIKPFVAYRVALGVVLLVLLGTGRLKPTRPDATDTAATGTAATGTAAMLTTAHVPQVR